MKRAIVQVLALLLVASLIGCDAVIVPAIRLEEGLEHVLRKPDRTPPVPISQEAP